MGGLSAEVLSIVEEIDPDMGRLILRKHCRELGVEPNELEAAHIIPLKEAMTPAVTQLLGTSAGERLAERLDLLAGGDSPSPASVDPSLLLERGLDAKKQGDWDEAREIFTDLAELLRASQHESLATVLENLALVLREQCEWEVAIRTYEEFRSLQDARNDQQGMAKAELGLGTICWQRGDYDAALSHFDAGMAHSQATNDQALLGESYLLYGNVYSDMSRIQEALKYYDMALTILKEAHDDEQLARVNNNLGDIYLRKGDFEDAKRHFEKAIKYAERARDPLYEGWGHANMGEIHARSGDAVEADKELDQAEKVFEKIGDLIGLGTITASRGILARRTKDFEKSEELLFQAILELQPLDAPFHVGHAYLELGTLFLAMQRKDEAKDALKDARRIFKRLGLKGELEQVDKKLSAPILQE